MMETATATAAERSQITDRLLDAAGISVDRLPMLPVVFDRMVRIFADAMRQKSTSPSYISVSYIDNERIGDVLDEYEINALVAVYYSPEWDSRILIGFDRDFIFTLADVLFGADGTEPPIDEERNFSNIETRGSPTRSSRRPPRPFRIPLSRSQKPKSNWSASKAGWTSPFSADATIRPWWPGFLSRRSGAAAKFSSSCRTPPSIHCASACRRSFSAK